MMLAIQSLRQPLETRGNMCLRRIAMKQMSYPRARLKVLSLAQRQALGSARRKNQRNGSRQDLPQAIPISLTATLVDALYTRLHFCASNLWSRLITSEFV